MSLFRRRHSRFRRSGTQLKWLVIILIVVGILAAVLGFRGGAIDFIDHYFNYRDTSYQPLDIDRHINDNTQKNTR
jgi:hypothetical protein